MDWDWVDRVRDGFEGAVGRTPLVRLKTVSEQTGCTILAKAEWMQPGGSVKDRAAVYCVRAAEESGELREGGIVVEGTGGNTGIGLAHVCAARGYRCVIFMPDTMAKEKVEALVQLGAEVHSVPDAPYTDDKNYQKQARDYAAATPGAVWTSQFENLANRQAHMETTGPEIWMQTKGTVNAFVCATGTGGTLAGTAMYMKDNHPQVKCFLADPHGSTLYNWVVTGKADKNGVSSIAEGIGNGRVTGNMEGTRHLYDGAVCVSDEEAVRMLFHLLQREGVFAGVSSALNVCAAVQVAKLLGPGHTIVTILCDSGQRYKSKILSKSFLESKGLLHCVPAEMHGRLSE